MNTWQEDQLQELYSSKCEQTLFRSITKLVSSLGFDSCCYSMRMPLPISSPALVVFNNNPSAWQHEYQQKNYLAIDPAVKYAMCSQAPLAWSDQVFAQSLALGNNVQDIDPRVGWTLPTRDAQNVVGLLTLARSAEALTLAETREKQFKLAWLAQTAHFGMARYLTPKLLPGIQAQLSSREIEVLRWTADGKTAGDIAEILKLTKRTIDFHSSQAAAKLGVANKTVAVIHAAILGFL